MADTTFTWFPDVDGDLSVKPLVEVTAFGDGYESRTAKGINTQKMVWTMVFTRARPEATAILTFVRARNAVEAFNWTNPLQELGVYVCREWKVKSMRGGNLQISLSFEQVFEA
jgi:phage-related protein